MTQQERETDIEINKFLANPYITINYIINFTEYLDIEYSFSNVLVEKRFTRSYKVNLKKDLTLQNKIKFLNEINNWKSNMTANGKQIRDIFESIL